MYSVCCLGSKIVNLLIHVASHLAFRPLVDETGSLDHTLYAQDQSLQHVGSGWFASQIIDWTLKKAKPKSSLVSRDKYAAALFT